jgi:hypothetical protein
MARALAVALLIMPSRAIIAVCWTILTRSVLTIHVLAVSVLTVGGWSAPIAASATATPALTTASPTRVHARLTLVEAS